MFTYSNDVGNDKGGGGPDNQKHRKKTQPLFEPIHFSNRTDGAI